ncbi:MAG: LacI family DNA-binding transcriptional regulator [Planctomycetota bacterium]
MTHLRPNKITLKDVADEAGCSKSVASAVLNGSRGNIGFSNELRDRVLVAARRLGYSVNFASQSLALRRTRTLGVYIDPLLGGGIAGHYHLKILSGIEAAAVENRYDVLLVNFAGDTTVAGCIDKISQSRIDGLLLLHTGRNPTLVDAVLEATSRVVAIDTLDPPNALQAVTYDHADAVRQAVEHFVSLGHRRLGYAGPFSTRPVAHCRARLDALRREAAARGLILPERSLFFSEDTAETPSAMSSSARFVQEQFLALPPDERPTALLANNDRLAADLMGGLADAGLSVPHDVSLVTFENTPITQVTRPALTCLDHPLTEMAHRGTTRLIEAIESDPAPPSTGPAEPWHVVFPARLILRGTTAPSPASS